MGANKILLEVYDFSHKMNLVRYPKPHAPHTSFRLPRPHSHWSATGPRSKQHFQPKLLHTNRSGINTKLSAQGTGGQTTWRDG
jgi:hypothetical protein